MGLIDKNALKETILKQHPRGEDILKIIEDDIENTQVIESTSVVHCKDCKYMDWDNEEVGTIYCNHFGYGWCKPEDFCSFGEEEKKCGD